MPIGRPLARPEDAALLRGEGRYTDDLNEPGQAYACVVRSPHAHGRIRAIGILEALALPGVLAVYTAGDLAGYGLHKCLAPLPGLKVPARRALAQDRVRFVGDPVACVVAGSAQQAKDAAEAVRLDIEPLPAVALASEAAQPGAAQLYDEVPGNVAVDYRYGDAIAQNP